MTATRILAQFGLTARIGPIGCNASLPQLVEALGQPFTGDRVSRKQRWPHWFGYGSLQLVVCGCRLVTMVIVPAGQGEIEVPDARTNAMVTLPSELTYSQLTAALDEAGCSWTRGQELPGHCSVETAVDAIRTSFVFTTTESYDGPALTDPELCKVVSHVAHDCPPTAHGRPDDGFGAD